MTTGKISLIWCSKLCFDFFDKKFYSFFLDNYKFCDKILKSLYVGEYKRYNSLVIAFESFCREALENFSLTDHKAKNGFDNFFCRFYQGNSYVKPVSEEQYQQTIKELAVICYALGYNNYKMPEGVFSQDEEDLIICGKAAIQEQKNNSQHSEDSKKIVQDTKEPEDINQALQAENLELKKEILRLQNAIKTEKQNYESLVNKLVNYRPSQEDIAEYLPGWLKIMGSLDDPEGFRVSREFERDGEIIRQTIEVAFSE